MDTEPVYMEQAAFEDHKAEGSLKPREVMLPEERKYVDKLLRIIKQEESKASKAIKQSIDIIDSALEDEENSFCERKTS